MLKLILGFGMAAALPVASLAASPAKTVEAVVVEGSGSHIGTVLLHEAPSGVLMVLKIKGMSPGWHGMHFHQTGDCTDGFKKAGGHILRTRDAHGAHDGHDGSSHSAGHLASGLLNEKTNDAGALPNIYVSSDGTAAVEILTTFVSFGGQGDRPALLDADGSSLIIHEGPEDQTGTKDTVGKRSACAAIRGK
jgi:Cu-Zn family superoxide dismutase